MVSYVNVLTELNLIAKETAPMLTNVLKIHVLLMLSVTTSAMAVDTVVNVPVDTKVMAIVSVMSHHSIATIQNKMALFVAESYSWDAFLHLKMKLFVM